MNGRKLTDTLIVPLDQKYGEWMRKTKLWQVRHLNGIKEKKRNLETSSDKKHIE